ncbi:MAG: hypothetical protein J6B31_06785 [Bacteroidaceae bacterium]|nr:hypothetical protein [Bacteroidaceae bacterium]
MEQNRVEMECGCLSDYADFCNHRKQKGYEQKID